MHHDVATAASDEAPGTGGEGGCAGAGAAGLGDPGAAFVHAHRDLVRLGSRFDDLEVDVRHLAAEVGEVDDGDLVDADDAVRVAEAEVRDRTVGVAPECRPTSGSSIVDTSPMSTRAVIVAGSSVASSTTSRSPASVRISWSDEVAAPVGERLGEAADAVAAHLGPDPSAL